MLLLLSNNEYSSKNDFVESEARLDEALSNSDLQRMSVPGDGDCCFASVSYGIDYFFDTNHEVCSHLQALNLAPNQPVVERISILRKLVIDEWLGLNSEQYSLHLTSPHQCTFEETAMSFIEQGICDCELGNSVLLAMTNVLRIPIIIYSSISSYPIIPLIPKEVPLSNDPIYVAFNQSGKGHYDAVSSISKQRYHLLILISLRNQIKEERYLVHVAREEQKIKVKIFATAMDHAVNAIKILLDAAYCAGVSTVELEIPMARENLDQKIMHCHSVKEENMMISPCLLCSSLKE